MTAYNSPPMEPNNDPSPVSDDNDRLKELRQRRDDKQRLLDDRIEEMKRVSGLVLAKWREITHPDNNPAASAIRETFLETRETPEFHSHLEEQRKMCRFLTQEELEIVTYMTFFRGSGRRTSSN